MAIPQNSPNFFDNEMGATHPNPFDGKIVPMTRLGDSWVGTVLGAAYVAMWFGITVKVSYVGFRFISNMVSKVFGPR